MYWLYIIYAKLQVNRFENGFHIVQKLWKCPYEKFLNSFFWQKYAIQKDENSTIELPVKFCVEKMLFVVKLTALKCSPFFTGISQIHVLNLLVTSFRLPPFVHFYGPSFFELAGGNIFTPPSPARLAGDPSPARVKGNCSPPENTYFYLVLNRILA